MPRKLSQITKENVKNRPFFSKTKARKNIELLVYDRVVLDSNQILQN